MTNEEFKLIQRVNPNLIFDCAYCMMSAKTKEAVFKDDKLFCSQVCAERGLSLLIKRQPPAVKAGNMDV